MGSASSPGAPTWQEYNVGFTERALPPAGRTEDPMLRAALLLGGKAHHLYTPSLLILNAHRAMPAPGSEPQEQCGLTSPAFCLKGAGALLT